MLEVTDVVFLDGGRRLASVSDDKTLKIWDATNGEMVLSLREGAHELTGLAVSPNGQRLASASGIGTKIWDTTPVDAMAGEEALTLLGHTDLIWGLDFSPDGRRLASASGDATVRVWDARTGYEEHVYRQHVRTVFDVAFSPDGRNIASVSWQLAEGEPSYLQVWDATTGKDILRLRGSTVEGRSVAFSPHDGRWLVTGSHRGELTVWDTTTDRIVRTLQPNPELDSASVWGLVFSPGGQRLVSVTREGMVIVYDATRWGEKIPQEPLFTFQAYKTPIRGSAAFGPDGRLVMPGDENTVNVWDVSQSGKRDGLVPQLTLRGHTAQVWGVAISPDGRWVASGGEDNTVKLCDAHIGGELLYTFRGHSSVVSRVAFSPDGKRLASASFDKTVRVWNVSR
jgi:WD40 repeat protein